MSIIYRSHVEGILQNNPSLYGTEIANLLVEHGEIALHVVFTFTNGDREQLMMYLPSNITQKGFMQQVFLELGKQSKSLHKVNAVQLYFPETPAKFIPSGTCTWEFGGTRRTAADHNTWRREFINSMRLGKALDKTGGSNDHKNTGALRDICRTYLNCGLDRDEIERRFRKVYDGACRHLRDPINLKIGRRLIRYIYDKTDRVWFNGTIQPYLREKFGNDLECIKNPRLRTTAGRFSFGEDGTNPRLEIATSVFNKLFTNGEKNLKLGGLNATNRLEFLILTIHHELCHLLVILYDREKGVINGGHGPLFRKFILHTFGHTDYKHDGFSGDTDNAVKMANEILPGYTVQFRDKAGVIREGVVVNKRSAFAVIHDYNKGVAYGNILKIVDRSTTVPVAKSTKASIDLGKLSVGQKLGFNKKSHTLACTLLAYTTKRAKVRCDDGKEWYVPWRMISID